MEKKESIKLPIWALMIAIAAILGTGKALADIQTLKDQRREMREDFQMFKKELKEDFNLFKAELKTVVIKAVTQ